MTASLIAVAALLLAGSIYAYAYLRGHRAGHGLGWRFGHLAGEQAGAREAEKRARTAEEALDYIMHEIVKREFPPSDSKRRFPGPDLESQVGDTIDLREPL